MDKPGICAAARTSDKVARFHALISMQSKRITIRDIARRARVATGTVSMALNGNPRIPEVTREQVLRVAQELGYVYDRGAGQLRNKRTNIVGVSVCNLVNPYFAAVTAGIQESLEQAKRVAFLSNCAESIPRQLKFFETIREYHVAGLVVTPAIGTPRAHIQQLLDWNIPLVMVTRYIRGVRTDYVGNDNRLGSRLATRHLISLGHKRIGYIGRSRLTTTGQDRYSGFRETLAAASIDVSPDWVVDCGPTERRDGFDAILGLFEKTSPPTAVVCFNDVLAFGVMLGLRRLGLEPGRDCSVVGADNTSEAALWQPPLTTVAVDFDQVGRASGQLLEERINHPDRPVEKIVLAPRLIVRASTGPAPTVSSLSGRRIVSAV
jgi:LacI family transcriptional regulator